MNDPIEAAISQWAAVPEDVVPQRRGRPPKAVVTRLLANNGKQVTTHDTEITEDVDGTPTGVTHRTMAATLNVDLAQLGWTQEEYDNPEITE